MEQSQQQYHAYTTTSFFKDEQFVQHVLKGDASSNSYWEGVYRDYPEKIAAMNEARAWVLLINKQKVYTPGGDRSQLWSKISDDIAGYERRRETIYRPLKVVSIWIGAAAAVLLLIVGFNEWSALGEKQHHTVFGVREQLVLPDESVVTLNGNSTIHYARTWKSDKPRQIWLNGEAFFEVKHVAVKNRLRESDSFQVHVSDLSLTVTGTKFNVSNRRSITEISLLEGSIRIEKSGPGAFVKLLKPGEAFEYDSLQQSLTPMGRKPQANNAWTKNEMVLDGYTLQEIVNVLQDTYGYEITLQSPALGQKILSGTAPANSAEDILFVIRHALNLKINRTANHLTLSQN